MKKLLFTILAIITSATVYAAPYQCYNTYSGQDCGADYVMLGLNCGAATDAGDPNASSVASWDAYCDGLAHGSGVNCLATAWNAAYNAAVCRCDTGWTGSLCDTCASGYILIGGNCVAFSSNSTIYDDDKTSGSATPDTVVTTVDPLTGLDADKITAIASNENVFTVDPHSDDLFWIKGRTSDGSTNILMGADSSGSDKFWVDTLGNESAYAWKSTKQLGNIIGPNDWATNADFSDWTGSTPDEFTVWDFGGGSGSDVSQEAVIYQSAPYSVKIVGGSGGAPDKIIGRSVTGLTPSSGYGFGFSLKRETGIATYCQLILINGADLGTSTQQWIDTPYKIEYSGASGSFAQGDTWSTATGSGYISEVYPTYLVVTLGGGSVTMGQTITSGGSVTATVDADASTLTAGWYTIIANNPTSKLATISTDDWSSEGITLTVPASGIITFIWAAEDNKTLYLDDVIAATITTATGTVFDFSNASDISTISSPSKIIDFRFTGGTAGSAYNLNASGFWGSDYFTSWNFGALDVSIPQGDFTVTLGDSTVRDIQVDLITNNLASANDDYVQHFLDNSNRTKSMSVITAGSSSTPIETFGFTTSLVHVAANGDNISAAHSSVATYGLDAGEVVSAHRATIAGNASDNADSYIGAFMAYGAASGGKGAGLLLDQRSTPFDYGVLSYGNDLILGTQTAYGTTASGPDVILKASNAAVSGDGGSVVAILGEGQTGENGAFAFQLDTSKFGDIFTDDKNAVLFRSYATATSGVIAFYLGAQNDIADDDILLSVGDDIASGYSEKYNIDALGRQKWGTFANVATDDKNSLFLVSNASDVENVSVFTLAARNEIVQATAKLLTIGHDYDNTFENALTLDALGQVELGEFGTITTDEYRSMMFAGNTSGGTAVRFGNKTLMTLGTDRIAEFYNDNFLTLQAYMRLNGAFYSGTDANETDFPDGQGVFANGNTGLASSHKIGVVGEGIATGTQDGIGVLGLSKASATNDAHAGYFIATVDDTSNTTDARAASFLSIATHAGGDNIGINISAAGGANNYAIRSLLGNMVFYGNAWFGANADKADFTQSKIIVSQANTGATNTGLIGLVGEAVSDGSDPAYGLYGYGQTNDAVGAAGIAGVGLAGNSAYTGPAYGGFFSAVDSHAGNNIAVNAVALNAGAGNAYSIQASGIAKFTGQFAHAPSSDLSLSAGDSITITRGIMRVVGNGGAVTLTSTPTIVAPVEDGTIVILQGDDDTNTVTLQDESSLADTDLQLAGGNNMVLGKGDTITLTYDSGDAKWYEIARSNN